LEKSNSTNTQTICHHNKPCLTEFHQINEVVVKTIILNRNHGKTAFIRILGAEISGVLGSQITGFNEGLIDLSCFKNQVENYIHH